MEKIPMKKRQTSEFLRFADGSYMLVTRDSWKAFLVFLENKGLTRESSSTYSLAPEGSHGTHGMGIQTR